MRLCKIREHGLLHVCYRALTDLGQINRVVTDLLHICHNSVNNFSKFVNWILYRYRGGYRILKGGSLRSSYAYIVLCNKTGMQSMPILGGLGACPPRKFLKITLSEIDSGAF